MGRKRHTPEQIITGLREAEVGLARGKSVKLISRELGITEQTYYRWRREYGGMKVSQARRLKELERENGRLKRAVADLTLDKLDRGGSGPGKLLSPERRRRCVVRVRQQLGASERRACRVLGQPRTTQRRALQEILVQGTSTRHNTTDRVRSRDRRVHRPVVTQHKSRSGLEGVMSDTCLPGPVGTSSPCISLFWIDVTGIQGGPVLWHDSQEVVPGHFLCSASGQSR